MDDHYTHLNTYLYQRPPQVGGLLIYNKPTDPFHSVSCYHIPMRPSNMLGGIMSESPDPNAPLTTRNQSVIALTKALSNNLLEASSDNPNILIESIHHAVNKVSNILTAPTIFGTALIAGQGSYLVLGTSGNIDIYAADLKGRVINNGNPLHHVHYLDMQKTQVQHLGTNIVLHEAYQVEVFSLEEDMRFIIMMSTHWKEIYGATHIPAIIQQSLMEYVDFIHNQLPLHTTLQTWGEYIYKTQKKNATHDLGMIVIERPMYVELYKTKSFKKGTAM